MGGGIGILEQHSKQVLDILKSILERAAVTVVFVSGCTFNLIKGLIRELSFLVG